MSEWREQYLPGIAAAEPPTVHPVAALFPMMSDEELTDLAADIKANGQIHAIVLDSDGQLIDGRNRQAACKIAGVDPAYERLPEGQDAVAYILSANVSRRHLSKGQAAMAVARARGFLKTASFREVAETAGTSKARVAYAAVVLEHAPELADSVLSGATPLNDAYETAKQRRAAATSREAQMERLRADASDLGDLVVEERMTLAEAIAACQERQRRERQQQEVTTNLLTNTLTFLDPRAMDPAELAAGVVQRVNRELAPQGEPISAERIRRCAAALIAIADMLEE